MALPRYRTSSSTSNFGLWCGMSVCFSWFEELRNTKAPGAFYR